MTVNRLAIQQLIKAMEAPDGALGFNMAFFWGPTSRLYPDQSGQNCGTSGCIAGWAVHTLVGPVTGEEDRLIADMAREVLGLDHDTAQALFYGHPDPQLASDITLSQAIQVLEHLCLNGEVDWNRTYAVASDTTPPEAA